MTTSHWAASADIVELFQSTMTKYHPELIQAGVKLGIWMASSSSGTAVKHGGYPAAATVRITSLKDRVKLQYDVEVNIDAGVWSDLPEQCKVALADHELSHIEVKYEKVKKKAKRDPDEEQEDEGGEESAAPVVKKDDIGRPQLKLRKGDWYGGDGFVVVVQRHGQFALEQLNADRVAAILAPYAVIDTVLPRLTLDTDG